MKRMLTTLAVAAAALATTAAQAQTATGAYNGHTYNYYSGPLSFADANAAAADVGGYLATITSQGEQDFLFALLNGATAYAGGSDGAVEGTWRWLGGPETGQSFYSASGASVDIDYSFWNGGEPNNFGGENALVINWNRGTGQWNDINPTSTYGYVVELDPAQPGGVPEPATWAMVIGGFGLVGATMRRRRLDLAAA